MTPDSKKKTTTKIPAKKKVAGKVAASPGVTPAKKVTKKASSSTSKVSTKKVAKKAVVSPREAPAKEMTRKSATTSRPDTSSINITSEERWKMIAIAAYHRAEKRGFEPGGELQDWAEAEQEVDELLKSS